MKLLKTDQKDFYKPSGSIGVINTNVKAFKQYKQMRDGNNRVSVLEDEIKDLKEMVKQLLDSKK